MGQRRMCHEVRPDATAMPPPPPGTEQETDKPCNKLEESDKDDWLWKSG
jgi:hypothetical protein